MKIPQPTHSAAVFVSAKLRRRSSTHSVAYDLDDASRALDGGPRRGARPREGRARPLTSAIRSCTALLAFEGAGNRRSRLASAARRRRRRHARRTGFPPGRPSSLRRATPCQTDEPASCNRPSSSGVSRSPSTSATPAVAHDQHAVAGVAELLVVGGGDDTTAPCRRGVADQPVDGGLGADVDALGRLVEEQHPRPAAQPVGEHDLLLVAARQLAEDRVGARAGGRRGARSNRRPRALAGAVAARPAASVRAGRSASVLAHGQPDDGRPRSAVGRHGAHAGGSRRADCGATVCRRPGPARRGGTAPNSSGWSSSRPEPVRPAMPSDLTARPSRSTCRLSPPSPRTSGDVAGRVRRCRGQARRSSSRRASGARASPGRVGDVSVPTRPSRSTVTRSAIARTSSRRWRERARRGPPRDAAQRPRTGARPPRAAATRSARRARAPAPSSQSQRARAIATPVRSAALSSRHRPAASSSKPERAQALRGARRSAPQRMRPPAPVAKPRPRVEVLDRGQRLDEAEVLVHEAQPGVARASCRAARTARRRARPAPGSGWW